MATTMDIRLDYGAWPGDEGDSEESASSLEPTPAFDQTSEADGRQSDNTSNPQQPPDLSISDLFSDSDDIVPDQEFLDAEINMGAAASTANGTSHHTSDPQNPPRRTNRLNSTYATDSPIIDLTESPPQPSERPALTPQGESSQQPSTMPPTLRSHVQPRRVQAAPTAASQSEERPRKRRRLSQSQRSAAEVEQPPQQPVTNDNPAEIEALDLTEVNDESDLSKAISKQQQDAVEAQMKDTSGDECQGRTPLSSYKCPICMDTPEDATSTICGHLFCHKCILDTLRFSEQSRRDHHDTPHNKSTKGTCPVCRKPLARKDEPGTGRTLVPLEIKLSTKRDLKGKGIVGRNDGSGLKGRVRAKTEREASADMWREYTNLEHG